MYIIKNAWINIVRNKRRNILLGIIIMVIALCSTVTLAINNTSSKLINSYKDAFQVEASISFNRGNMRDKFDMSNKEDFKEMQNKFDKIESLNVLDIKKYSESKYVKEYSYIIKTSMNGKTIEKVSSEFSFGGKNSNRGKGPNGNMSNNGDFTLDGYSSIESMNDFISGNYKIEEKDEEIWTKIVSGKNAIINSELAQLNNLKVGSTFKLTDTSSSKNYTFTVVGIYSESESSNMNLFSSSANTIITSADILEKISASNTNVKISVTPKYMLNSFEDAEKFESELHTLGLDENYSVTTNIDEVTNSTKSIENLKSFSMTFLVITLLIGVIVLFVINEINIRERKYEIGVLRTIGMKKSSLTLQFTLEILMTSIFALVLGLACGSVLSKPISNNLLQNEIESSKENFDNIKDNFGGNLNFDKGNRPNIFNGVVEVSAFDKIDAIVDIKVVLELLLIGICLTIISSVSTMISIQKFSPLEILKERS